LKKNELVLYIEEALRTEESANRIYYKHLQTLFGMTGISDDKKNRSKEILDKLISENKRHALILENVLMKLEEDSKDDF